MNDYLKKITLLADAFMSDAIKNLNDSGLQIVLLIDKNNKPKEQTIGKYEADMISGAINNNEKGL